MMLGGSKNKVSILGLSILSILVVGSTGFGFEDAYAGSGPVWDFIWDGDVDPTDVSAGFSVAGSAIPISCNPATGVVGEDFLLDTTIAESCSWEKTVGFDSATGYTVEARIKVDTFLGGGTTSGIGIAANDSDQRIWTFLYSAANPNAVGGVVGLFPGTGIVLLDSSALADTADDFHIYRMTVDGSTYTVYIDGTIVSTGTISGETFNFDLFFGDTASAAGGISTWDYIAYSTGGAYDDLQLASPPPSPTTPTDTTPPNLTVPDDLEFEATGNPLTANVFDLDPEDQLDADDPDSSIGPITDDAPAEFNFGANQVTYSVTSEGGTTEGIQTITIVDNTPPEVTDPPNIVGFEAEGEFTSIDIGTALATDIFEIVNIFSDAPATFPVGITPVHWSAEDANGNIGTTATQTVEVVDTTDPTFDSLPLADVTEEATGPTGAIVIYTTPTASDIADPSVDVACLAASGTTFELGDTLVTCTATDDSGNDAEATFTVTVEDTTPPDITLVGANPQIIEAGNAYSELGATADDLVDGDLTGSIIIDASAINTEFPGDYDVTYDVTDAAGNSAQETRTVTVVDTTPPEFTVVPTPARQEGNDDLTTKQFIFTVTATDDPRITQPTVNCTDEFGTVTDTDPTPGTIGTVDADHASTPGINTVTCTAVDDAGNTDTSLGADATTFDLIVSEIIITSISNDSPMWNQSTTLYFDAYGFLAGEEIVVTNGDDGPTVVSLGGADPDGESLSNDHAFSMSTSDTIQTISIELVETASPTTIHATSIPQDVNIQKHPSAFVADEDQIPDGLHWGSFFSAVEGDLNDTSGLAGTGGIPGAFVDIYGNGMGNFPFEVITDVNGHFTAEGEIMSRVGTDTMRFAYAGDQFYDPVAELDENTHTYMTEKRDSIIHAYPVDPVLAGTDITITGSFKDAISLDAIPDREITVEVLAPSTPFPIIPAQTSTPSRLQSTSAFVITDESPDPDIIQFKAGDFGFHDSSPLYVVLYVEPMGDTTAKIKYSDSNGNGQTISVFNSGVDTIPIQLDTGAGVEMWQVLSVSDGGNAPILDYVPISKIEEWNIHLETTLVMEFDAGGVPTSFLQFGGLATTGTTNTTHEEDIKLKLSFTDSGDPLYNISSFEFLPGEGFFTTPFTDTVLGASATGSTGTEVDDTGVGIVPISCKVADTDADAICPEWESDWVTDLSIQADDGIPFKIGSVSHFYKLPGTSEGTQDLIAEWDAMTYTESSTSKTHAPSAQAKADIIAAFGNYGINLIVQPNSDEIPHDDLITMWTDFNDLKREYFGTTSEQIDVDGTTASETIKQQTLLLALEDNLNDDSGFGNNGVINTIAGGSTEDGTEIYVAGPDGKAFSFDGTTHIELADTPFDFEHNDAFSVAAWIKTPNSANTDVMFGKIQPGPLGYQFFIQGADELQFTIGEDPGKIIKKTDITTLTEPINVRNDEWHHVAVSYDGSGDAIGVTFYVDGKKIDESNTITVSDTLTGQSIQNDQKITIGNQRPDATFYYEGQMDDVRVFEFELTEGQVTSLYETFVASSLAHYKLDGDYTDGLGGVTGNTKGDPQFVTGLIDDAIDLDGNDHIAIDDATFDFEKNEDFTLATWLNTSTTGVTDVFLGKLDRGKGYQMFLNSANEVQITVGNSKTSKIVAKTNGADVRDGDWHHIAMTYEGTKGESASSVKVYIDGVEAALTVVQDDLDATIQNNKKLTLGNQNDAGKHYFTGKLDDVRVYDYVLNSMQIANIADPKTLLQSLLEVSGIKLTTPDTGFTEGDTEAIIKMSFDVTHDATTALTGDDNGKIKLVTSTLDGESADRARVSSVEDPFTANTNILAIRAPVWTDEPVSNVDIGTIQVPLISQSKIISISPRGDITGTTSLLNALAQVERYCLFVHGIGGQSGQAELRGNDCVIALGDGFSDEDLGGHAEGSDDEMTGTVLHEFGHMLNMRHGGPNYLLSDKDTTLDASLENCIPIQRSVMTYAYQLPDFLGDDWVAEFNERDASTEGAFATLNEADGVLEDDGWVLSDSPVIFWGTPNSAFWETRSGIADGSPLDWSGDGDTNEPSANYDLNHIESVSGCEATEDSEFTIYNEPDQFDFDFRSGPLGEFDAKKKQQTDSEPNRITVKALKLAGAEFIVLPPMKIDGEEYFKAGRNVPMHMLLSQKDGTPITDAIPNIEIRIFHVLPQEDPANPGKLEKESIGTFFYNQDAMRWDFAWDTEKDYSVFGETGVNYVLTTLDDNGNVVGERKLLISELVNDMPLKVSADGITEGVTVKVKWK